MSSILSQNAPADAVPDFRNLGVVARTILIVNLAALLAAAVRADSFVQFVDTFVDIAVVAEPALIATLAVLYVAQPAIARLAYAAGLAAIFAVVLAVSALTWSLWAVASNEPVGQGLARMLASALLVAAFAAGYFFLRNRAFSPALAEARLQALQARIRPHFLFNSLNAVLSLIRTDARRAEAALEDLAELYRMLMADTRSLTTLANEIEVTRQYLNLELLRLGERLNVDWRIETAPRDALVPPLFLQPLVENAVYHGIEPGLEPGTIEIAIYVDGDRLHVRLTNPYHAEHQHRQGNRMALGNIRERLALHFDVEAALETGVVGTNYEIHMVMPYRRSG